MKKCFAVLIFILNSSLASALSSIEKEGFLVETFFSYKNKSINVNYSKLQFFDDDIETWVPLSDNKEKVLLLGRIVEDYSGYKKWEFIVVDSGSSNTFVLSNASSNIDENGKASLISKTDTGATVKVSINTSRTKYLEYPGASQKDVLKWMQR